MTDSRPVLVVGTGAWGTALSIMLGRRRPVTLLCRTDEEARALREAGRNTRFMADVPFPPLLRPEHDAEKACADARVVVLLTPSGRIGENARVLAPYLTRDHVVLSGAKGLERGSLRRMTEVVASELSGRGVERIGALSGPNLAREIAEGKPATAVVASADRRVLDAALPALATPQVRVYANTDVVGVELGGALKNIIAIGAGAADGLEAGDNAKAAFVTRGLAEIARLGVAEGADPMTFAGLSGLGDLLATVSSAGSRNRFVGQELARGRSVAEVRTLLAPHVAEGIETTAAARELARRHGVDMPITEQTYTVLFEGRSVPAAFAELMLRDPRHELEGLTGDR